MLNIGLFIPTLNAGKKWEELLISIHSQQFVFFKKVIVDSGSQDRTIELAEKYGFDVYQIHKSEFDHGGTRNMALELLHGCDVIVYLTQDVLLAQKDSIKKLVRVFENDEIACTYGRQLPHIDANPLAKHARYFNYPDRSILKSKLLIPQIGFKTCFVSNSFSAYRYKDLQDAGGFPSKIIFAEDAFLISRFILKNKMIYYNAEACVFHSHNYTYLEEFKRYFDIGVFHSTNSWIIKEFGTASGEGIKYFKSELKYLLSNSSLWIFASFISILVKFVAYKLGCQFKKLPLKFIKKLSLNKCYWNNIAIK